MADDQQVPPPVDDSADRVQARDASGSFARLPDDETHPRTEPGAGPYGSTATGGTNGPIVLMAIGALIVAAVFVFRSPWVFALGVVVFLAAAVWAGVDGRSRGHMAGSGPSPKDSDDR